MSNIEIRVLASADPSLRNVYRPFEEATTRARQLAAREAQSMARDRGAVLRRMTADEASIIAAAGRRREQQNNVILTQQRRAAQAEFRAFDQELNQRQRLRQSVDRAAERDRTRAANDAARDAGRRAKAEADAEISHQRRAVREQMRLFDDRLRARQQASRQEEREVRDAVRAADRIERDRARTGRRSAAQRLATGREVYHDASQNLRAIGHYGSRAVGGFLQGAGVETSIGGTYGRGVDFQRRATELSNQGYDPDDPKKARRAPAEVATRIREAADATGFGRIEAAEGLDAFVAKTGDLETGLRLMKELGMLSKATGANLADMADAAGDVSNSLGDDFKGDRATAVSTLMKVFAGQGKAGAVEIKDLATQAAKLGASAGAFEGDPQAILSTMGGLVQMSRKMGGSASATQAATSVAAMVNTLKTPARMAAFKDAGVDILNPDTKLFRNPEDIITDSISKTRGDPEAFKAMWANVQGARGVEGFATVYRRARAGALEQGANDEQSNAAGVRAVRDQFDQYRKAAMDDPEIRESFDLRMRDPDTKAQLFNNRMEDVAGRVGETLLPALEKLAPAFEKIAEKAGSLLSWMAENPGSAITAAIVGSIAKASIGQSVGNAIANVLGGAGKQGSGGGVSTGNAALAIAAGAVTVTAAGIALIDNKMNEEDKAGDAFRSKQLTSAEARANAKVSTDPATRAAAIQSLLERNEEIKQQLGAGTQHSWVDNSSVGTVSAALNWASFGELGTSADEQDMKRRASQNAPELRGELTSNVSSLASILGDAGSSGGDISKLEAILKGQQTATADAVKAAIEAAFPKSMNVTVTNMPASGGPFVDPGGRLPDAAPQ